MPEAGAAQGGSDALHHIRGCDESGRGNDVPNIAHRDDAQPCADQQTDRHGKPRPPAEVFANSVWDVFESSWSTSYVVYPVNDGANPRYQQPTPKQRNIAYLRALAAGEEDTTMVGMQKEYEAILAREAAEREAAATR